MTQKPDGGPAFPWDPVYPSGMSLRDWFAGQALTTFQISTMASDETVSAIAGACYRVADAMIAARKAPSALTGGEGDG